MDNFQKMINDLLKGAGPQASTAMIVEAVLEQTSDELNSVMPSIEKFIDSQSPAIAKQIKALANFKTQLDIEAFKNYTTSGMSRDQAVALITSRNRSQANAVVDTISNASKK